jgi:hypothetical protein
MESRWVSRMNEYTKDTIYDTRRHDSVFGEIGEAKDGI